MALPYENATTGQKAMGEIEALLRRFGCASFGNMMDFERGELIVQFRWRDYPITVKASIAGYAAAWLKEHPWHPRRSRKTRQAHELEAKRIAGIAVYSILRDWIKGQITAIETGILSFEGAFLGQILLPSGETVLERMTQTGLLSLPKPEGGDAP